MLPLALSGATVVALGLVLLGEGRGWRVLVAVAKPAASAGFLGVAVSRGALASTYGSVVLGALVLSFVGDVCLLSRARRPFLAGLVTFLLGHVAFGAAFVVRGVEPASALGALALCAVSSVLVGRWLLPHVERRMRIPVIAYVVVITVMVALAAGAAAGGHAPLILAAALAFYASDLSVARDRFVRAAFANRLWGLPAYYGAQLLFAWTVAG